jgi:hypothetical protein
MHFALIGRSGSAARPFEGDIRLPAAAAAFRLIR